LGEVTREFVNQKGGEALADLGEKRSGRERSLSRRSMRLLEGDNCVIDWWTHKKEKIWEVNLGNSEKRKPSKNLHRLKNFTSTGVKKKRKEGSKKGSDHGLGEERGIRYRHRILQKNLYRKVHKPKLRNSLWKAVGSRETLWETEMNELLKEDNLEGLIKSYLKKKEEKTAKRALGGAL